MKLEIVKAHGTGNDFVIVEDLDASLDLDAATVAALCDRHRGVGADGLIRVAPDGGSGVFMDYRNADGSIAEMCGNGVRALAKYCFDRGILTGHEATIATRGGPKRVEVHPGADGRVAQVAVDMGPAILTSAEIPVAATPDELDAGFEIDVDGTAWQVFAVGMGNPHAVLDVRDVAAAPVAAVGAAIERDARFPNGTNVEFIEVRTPHSLHVRIWERGVGETLSCGTGACAAAVSAFRRGLVAATCDVHVPGGLLHVTVGEHVMLTGPAVEVFSAVVETDQLA